MNFSPETFMNTVLTEVNDTKIIPCPTGEWPAQIVEVTPKTGTISKGDRAGETWARLDVNWEITDPQVTSVTNREKTRVRQGVMLDLNPNGGLDMGPGKNVQLGRLREATGLNVSGAPFSPSMLLMRSGKVRVAHRIDERDGVTIQAEVQAVAAL
jgi:hypothetical protein